MKSRTKRTVTLVLTLALMLTLTAAAADVTTSYDYPVGIASAISGDLEGIILTDIPASYKAVLTNGARTLAAGDAVSAGDFGSLVLIPTAQADTTAEIGYIPVYATGELGQPSVISVGIFSKKNSAPICEDVNLETYKNIAITGDFKAQDPDGDELTFEITGAPKRGEVVLNGDGTFTYTPEKNKVGKDTFTYTTTDVKGNVSPQAKVNIVILKPTSKLTYADMAGNSAHYAAMRLVEAGVFTGEALGGSHYFKPEALVTRGEFLAAVLNLMEIDTADDAVTTGFADDASTPDWVKPYITTALKNGIISGVTTTSGSLVFRSEAYLTKAEAAVILNNVLNLTDSDTVFSSGEAVPAWASQASANLESAGILCADASGSLGLGDNVTRADMAVMLSKVMDVIAEREEDTGLLSWVFD